MKTLNVIVEKGTEGYGAYLEDVVGITGFGNTMDEAKRSIISGIREYVEYCKEEKINYEEELDNADQLNFTYKFDLQSLFEHFSYLNVTDLAEKIGINPSLLRKYKKGLAFAGEKQKQKIENALHEFGQELVNVQL